MKLRIEKLTKQYDDQKALDGINLDLSDITSLVLIGPSGSGKTTLLRVLAGLEKPEEGSIVLNDRILQFTQSDLLEYRKHIGVVFQAYNLFPHLMALDNIVLPLVKVHGLTKLKAETRAIELLKRFSLEEHMNKKPIQLSGGQQQRIAICRAAAMQPEIIFLDEPTSALDPEFTVEVLDLISELKSEGIEFILVTHEMGFAASTADQIVFMDEGKVLMCGSPDQIFNQSESIPRVKTFMDKILKYDTKI